MGFSVRPWGWQERGTFKRTRIRAAAGVGAYAGKPARSDEAGHRAPPATLLRYGLRVPNVTRIVETQASRTLLGAGSRRQIGDLVEGRKAFVVSSGSARRAAEEIDASTQVVGRFGRPVVHTPVVVTEDALEALQGAGAEVIVAFGGGSAVGLSKALAARTGLPQIVVPTTYAGSEVTPVLGETRAGVKQTRRDASLLPGTVVYDPELTVTMPAGLTLTSAINALAHSVEALWAPDATIVSDAYASESAAAILGALPAVLADLSDLAARERLQQGAWLAGLCLAQTRMGLHHQLAHTLGGAYDLPHAELHAMLLAHVMRFNLPAAPKAVDRLARVLDGDPIETVATLAGSYDGPRSLRDLGVPRDGLETAADRVLAAPYPNPRRLSRVELLKLLDAAW